MKRWPWFVSLAATWVVACSPAPAPPQGDGASDASAQDDGALQSDGSTAMDGSASCPSSFAEMQQRWFGPRCATAGCHSATMPSLNLDLSNASAEQRMINAPSLGCPPGQLIVAGDVGASVFYGKIAEASPTCGVRMPIGGAPFTADELSCVRAWINALPASSMDAGADSALGADASADSSPESSIACPMGQSDCSGTCVDTRTSATNCGMCGRACSAGQSCVAGACTTVCAMGQMLCAGACVDTRTSNANCGTCGRTCGAGSSCASSVCACMSGLTACGASCANTQSDANNCGTCGNACGVGFVCNAGACVRGACPLGQNNCSGSCVHTQTDPLNCGACGRMCAAGQSCTLGVCGCAAGSTSCSGSCVNLQSDSNNCGMCGRICSAGSTCTLGSCGCSAGSTLCGSSCVNTQTDALNCGTCGHACAAGQSCVMGACSSTCAAGQMLCSGACVDTNTSAANCGGCGRACSSGQMCVAGSCVGCSPVSFAGAVQPIFTANCTTGCHGGVRPASGLSLAAGSSYAALVNARSGCADGRVYVRPSDVNNSYLINKLTGVGMCSGSAMPVSGGPLPAASITTIRNWICNGAPNN